MDDGSVGSIAGDGAEGRTDVIEHPFPELLQLLRHFEFSHLSQPETESGGAFLGLEYLKAPAAESSSR